MRRRAGFWIVATLLVAINVTGWLIIGRRGGEDPRAPWVRVLSLLPADDADDADRISVIFDAPMIEAEGVGTPVDDPPFALEPHAAGHWVYARPEQLDFVLDEPLPPGRTFALRVNDDLERSTGRRLVGGRDLQITTRALAVRRCELASADRTHVTFEVTFDQPVIPRELANALRVSSGGGKTIDVEPLSREPATTITLRAARPDDDTLHVTIRPGLAGDGASRALASAWSDKLTIPRRFSLLGHAGQWSSPVSRRVTLRFSGALDPDQDLPAIEVAPPVSDLRFRIDRGRLHMTGSFAPGRRYVVDVPREILSLSGDTLPEPRTLTFTVPEPSPSVRFPHDRGILAPHGNLTLDLDVVNIDEVELTAERIYDNNLALHLRGLSSSYTGREVARFETTIDAPRNVPTKVGVDLRALLGSPVGVYRVTARAPGTWRRDWALVRITDLALTVKRGSANTAVWVTSIETGQPLADVAVEARSSSNQVLATAQTDERGLASLATSESIWVVTAERDGDLTYLEPNTRSWRIADVETGGRTIPNAHDVLLYAERGVHRPGDTVHLTGIVRTAEGEVPPPFPIAVTPRRADGRELEPLIATPNAQGVFHVDVSTNDVDPTGLWTFTATLPGSSARLGAGDTLVEAFEPVRLDVDVTPDAASFAHGIAPSITVTARYLDGRPAPGLPVKLRASFAPEGLDSTPYAEHRFAAWPAPGAPKTIEAKGTTGDDGQVAIELDVSNVHSRCRMSVTGTVTPLAGRPVSQHAAAIVDGRGIHVGVRGPGALVAAGAAFEIDYVVVDGDDVELAPETPVEVTLEHVFHDWQVVQRGSRQGWQSVERATPIETRRLDAASAGTTSLTCPEAGRYRVIVRAGDATTHLNLDATRDVGAVARSSTERPDRVELVLDRERYVPGSAATLLIRAPFDGTALVTVETDRVIDAFVIEVTDGETVAELPVDASIRGGAFVTTTIVRPVERTAATWLPHRALGVTRLVTDHSQHRLALRLDAPEHARPNETVTVRLASESAADPARPAVAHLWAVDEGILLTTDHHVDDPFDHFLAMRRLGTTSGDSYYDLLPDHERPESMMRIGGDRGSAARRRRNPVAEERAAPNVVWRRAITLGEDGAAEVDLSMPELVGGIRVLCVVVDGDRYAATERTIALSTPFEVEATWPRAVAAGDRFLVPVQLRNTTDEAAEVALEIEIDGPLVLESVPETVAVDAGDTEVLWIDAEATATGAIVAQVTASAGDETARHRASLTCRPAGPLDADVTLLALGAGARHELEMPSDLHDATVTLRLGASPHVDLVPAFDALIDYPYGCLEQTSSRLRALLAAHEAGAALIASPGDVAPLIDAGITRVWAMQTTSGGISYWPSSRDANLWSTAYAALVLIDARDAGFHVSSELLDGIGDYLGAQLDRHPPGALRAVICRVLAALGDDVRGWLATLDEALDDLDAASRGHLAVAWLDSGRLDRAEAALVDPPIGVEVETTTSGRLTSSVRQTAVLLDAFQRVAPDDAAVGLLVERLDATRRDGVWGSTLDTASALHVLTRHAANATPASFNGTIALGGETHAFDDGAPITVSAGASPIAVETTGTGTLHGVLVVEGLRADAAGHEVDAGLEVRRRWLDLDGDPIDLDRIHAGDLVQVEVTATRLGSTRRLDNVAIVDLLPGGFEIEHPRLATSAGASNTRTTRADRVEFLDDRVIIFTSVDGKTRTLRYVVRAVTAGDFVAPAIEGSCMYDAGVRSINGGGRVVVHPRGDG